MHALSEWFPEFSVLWAVFPVLDQFVEGGPVFTTLTALGVAISLASLVAGILLRRGDVR